MEASKTPDSALAEIAAGKAVGHVDHPEPAIRRLAASALRDPNRVESGTDPVLLLLRLATDIDENVRAEAIEALGSYGEPALGSVLSAAGDPSPIVVEAVATALGEIGDPAALDWLTEQAATHQDSPVQEAAVAALGAIGDDRALPTLLDLARTGKPQIRRRALVALTAFDAPEVRAVFARAMFDKNPMVREVAEMVEGKR